VIELGNVLTAFGLSGSAGLNAYVPLLVVALVARFTHLLRLQEPWTLLTNEWIIGLLVVLLVVEMLVDKVPAVDTVNDVVQTLIRPAAGAVLFAASSNVIGHVHPVLVLACGVLLAGGVHAIKATTRPVVTATTGGMATPVVSLLEDVVSLVTSLLAILLPALLAVVLVLILLVVVWWLWLRPAHARAGRGD
jgi:hypothetical protein